MAEKPICAVEDCGNPSVKLGLCNAHYLRKWRYGSETSGGTMFGAPKTTLRKLLSLVPTNDCILWPLGKSMGYGTINENGRPRRVHNLVCEMYHGAPGQKRFQAAHSCGNRLCLNPDHLRWATPEENSADRIAHGTVANGDRHYLAKLNDEQVINIRKARERGASYADLAREYNVSAGAIGCIIRRQTWKHV